MPSAARLLSALEQSELAATALALPAGWVVQVTAPHGQLAILPREYVHEQVRTFIADGQARRIYRHRWRPIR